jgi:hypothetical protein
MARETENLNTEFKNVQQDAEIQYYEYQLFILLLFSVRVFRGTREICVYEEYYVTL